MSAYMKYLRLISFVFTYTTSRAGHVQLFNMADKHAKVATRKKKMNSKSAHDLTLEDVLAVGGDKVGVISLLWFARCNKY